MAPVKETSQSIVRFSSQDPLHRAENLLLRNNRSWLSDKNDRSGRIEAEIHLAQAIKIAFINIVILLIMIQRQGRSVVRVLKSLLTKSECKPFEKDNCTEGNAGSAFVELLVGQSMWHAGKEYLPFLPATAMMSPADSKTGCNTNSVKMLSIASFCQGVANERWDRVRVICRQPFNKEKQFGLQFIDFIADDKEISSENGKEPAASPRQSLAQFRSMLSPSRNHSANLSLSSGLLSSPPTPTRAAGLVQAALKKGKDNQKQIRKSSTPTQRRTPSNKKRNSSSPYPVDAGTQRRKTASRSLAGDIEDEVECFLEAFNFDDLPLESMTYGHLKEQIERQRGCPLNKEERKIFLKLAQKAIQNVLDKRGDCDDKKSKLDTETPRNNEKEIIDLSTADGKSSRQSIEYFDSMVECPVCGRFFLSLALELHASSCGSSGEKDMKCTDDHDIIPETRKAEKQIEMVSSPEQIMDRVALDPTDFVSCPICFREFPASRINIHANFCAEMNFQLHTHPSAD